MKPLLFVDVDGVLNCPDDREPTHRVRLPSRGLARGLVINGQALDAPAEHRIPLWLVDGAAERLRRLAESFECVWATSWHASAPIGLTEILGHKQPWPLLDWGRDNFKLPAIVRHAADRPWAFIDDDAEWELRNTGAVAGMQGPSWLLVQTDTQVGLHDEHVLALERFARQLA